MHTSRSGPPPEERHVSLFNPARSSARPLTPAVPVDRIVAQARTLDERLAAARSPWLSGSSESDELDVERRLHEWRHAAAAGEDDQFAKRLAWDGLTLGQARAALDDRLLPSTGHRPAWADILQDALDDRDVTVRQTGASGSMPFEEVLEPFVRVAGRRVMAGAGTAWKRLSESARGALAEGLSNTLCSYAAQTLQLEFTVWRSTRQSGLDRLASSLSGRTDRRLYTAFTTALREGGLADLLAEYAVLARLLSVVTELWIEATLEFVGRLDADWPTLQEVFGSHEPLGRVIDLRPSLSDPHRGRRSVIALTFASGARVVYKPKDLGVDAAYDRLLAWLAARGAPIEFGRPALLVRDGYGWVEFVAHSPHQDSAETHRYYRNSGGVLCVLHLLGATDCHFENIIAAGEYPVPVDLETLLHHHTAERRRSGTEAEWKAEDDLARSVLATSMLPVWQIGDNGASVYDVSGLGGLTEQETQFQSAVWSQVNTDQMTMRFERAVFHPSSNLPVLSGPAAGPAEHRQAILEGFSAMYRFLISQRQGLREADGPLTGFGAAPVRVLLRNTSLYGRLHQQLMQPRYLRDGRDRGIYLERLCRLFMDRPERPTMWPAVAAERTAMERPDIPYLAARPDSDGLQLETGVTIAGCFREPSLQTLLDTVDALSDDTLDRQLAFIEGSLYAHIARDPAAVPATTAWGDPGVGDALPRTTEQLRNRALALVDELAAAAVRGEDGSAVWIAPQYLVKVGRYQFQSTGHDLYGGGAGVGLALAAAAQVSGDRAIAELALAALRPLREALIEEPARTAAQLGPGAAAGLGGAIYALTRSAELIGDDRLTVDAARAVRLVTPALIDADAALDVVSGSAGAILGLLAYAESAGATPASTDEAVGRAVDCGQRLLAGLRTTPSGQLSWAADGTRFLTGFSHGAAGIAYALGRLAERAGEERFAAAAADAIRYEDTLFDQAAGNWRDLRAEAVGGPGHATRWCHGAPGIVLARIGSSRQPLGDGVERDPRVARGLETTAGFGLERVDHLCCGNLGRVEVLLHAGRRLGRDDLVDQARTQAAAVLNRADATDPTGSSGFLLHPLAARVYTPGLFQGTAGLIYTLLRLAYPDRLRSVLLWE